MKKAVVKIGTASLTNVGGGIDREFIRSVCKQISHVKEEGWSIVIVSSGAIRAGAYRLNMKRRPHLIPDKQAAAAVGQGLLQQTYNECLSEYGLTAAQVLLTRDDFSDRARYLNARNTLAALLRHNVVPVVNENDTVSVDEIKFGDNDMLAALVATIVDASVVILLTDVPGLCRKKPRVGETVKVIDEVEKIDDDIIKLASGANILNGGTGGMISKLDAAKIATSAGIPLVIAPAKQPDVIQKILDGERIGTRFKPISQKLSGKKRWIAFGRQVRGSVVVNKGAVDSLIKHNKSLLAVGIVGTEGSFESGDLVKIVDENGVGIARGFINYNAEEVKKIMGKNSSEIKQTLGYKEYDEVIHRDNLVLGV